MHCSSIHNNVQINIQFGLTHISRCSILTLLMSSCYEASFSTSIVMQQKARKPKSKHINDIKRIQYINSIDETQLYLYLLLSDRHISHKFQKKQGQNIVSNSSSIQREIKPSVVKMFNFLKVFRKSISQYRELKYFRILALRPAFNKLAFPHLVRTSDFHQVMDTG